MWKGTKCYLIIFSSLQVWLTVEGCYFTNTKKKIVYIPRWPCQYNSGGYAEQLGNLGTAVFHLGLMEVYRGGVVQNYVFPI